MADSLSSSKRRRHDEEESDSEQQMGRFDDPSSMLAKLRSCKHALSNANTVIRNRDNTITKLKRDVAEVVRISRAKDQTIVRLQNTLDYAYAQVQDAENATDEVRVDLQQAMSDARKHRTQADELCAAVIEKDAMLSRQIEIHAFECITLSVQMQHLRSQYDALHSAKSEPPKCAICTVGAQDTALLCGHVFCDACASKAIADGACFVCRRACARATYEDEQCRPNVLSKIKLYTSDERQ
jgi:chromosome segregation ATPase